MGTLGHLQAVQQDPLRGNGMVDYDYTKAILVVFIAPAEVPATKVGLEAYLKVPANRTLFRLVLCDGLNRLLAAALRKIKVFLLFEMMTLAGCHQRSLHSNIVSASNQVQFFLPSFFINFSLATFFLPNLAPPHHHTPPPNTSGEHAPGNAAQHVRQQSDYHGCAAQPDEGQRRRQKECSR
jgi:hypothetical protein